MLTLSCLSLVCDWHGSHLIVLFVFWKSEYLARHWLQTICPHLSIMFWSVIWSSERQLSAGINLWSSSIRLVRQSITLCLWSLNNYCKSSCFILASLISFYDSIPAYWAAASAFFLILLIYLVNSSFASYNFVHSDLSCTTFKSNASSLPLMSFRTFSSYDWSSLISC